MLVRMDQLVLFQDTMANMSSNVQKLINSYSLNQAQFLYEYALQISWRLAALVQSAVGNFVTSF